jgi:tetratricopeptide (TPR) repeat protein
VSATTPPDPAGATTAAEFIDLMAGVRLWAGQPSLRTLHRLGGATTSPTGASTDALPTTTVSWVLNGKGLPRLPRMEFVESYIGACLAACRQPEHEIRGQLGRWRSAWRRIADQPDGDPAPALHQLPMDIDEFTGRHAELEALREYADQAGTATSPVVVVIEGMAGVGKTRVVIRAAHRLVAAGRFDDAQLWADLRGFHPDQPPTDPALILENFLRLLGVAAHHVPADIDGRAALYRDRLSRRRALVVLDDCLSEKQLRPLLPGAPGSLVLVTSRRTFTGLDGVHSVPVGPFSGPEALSLFERYAGQDRVRAEPLAAQRLMDMCGNLPLAVAVSARHLRARPLWRLEDLVTRLETDQRDLSSLSPPARAAARVIDLSYRSLSPAYQRLFRLLAVHPGRAVTAPSLAALADVSAPEAQAALDDLVDEHLLLPVAAHRYGLHDLVRHVVTEHSRRQDSEPERQAGLERLTRHYVTMARQATRLIHPTETRRIRIVPDEQPPWRTAAEAVDWAEEEYDNLVATVEQATNGHGACPRLALELVAALYRPLANRGHSTDRIKLNQLAVHLAERLGDKHAQAQAREDLGSICGQVGFTTEARAHSRTALTLWTELGEPTGMQGCLADLGNVCRQLGEYGEAIDHLERSLAIGVEAGNPHGEASVLSFLGQTHQRAGNVDAAIDCLTRSARAYRAAGNDLGEAIALANNGWAHHRTGQPHQAIAYHERSLAVFDRLGDHYNAAEQHWGIAQCRHNLGDQVTARHHWDTAITMLHRIQALDEHQAAHLRAQDVPDTPEIIRLNT